MLVSQILSHSSDTTGSACRLHDPCRGRKQVDEHHVDVSNEEDEYPYESIQEKKNMSKLLTIQEVQNELSVSRSSIYRLIGRGKFDVVYVLNAPRITQESIELFVAENLAAGTAVAR